MKSKILQKSIISLEIVLCLFLNMVALTSCNRKETQNEWNSELISNISEENMIETIENISRKPRCIGSKENDIVYDYTINFLIGQYAFKIIQSIRCSKLNIFTMHSFFVI